MTTFLMILHVIVCLAVVLVVLLQTGKGSDIGATFGGGGSQTLFGSRGAGNFLTKLTALCGAIFMITSLSLAILQSHATSSSIVREPAGKQSAPAKKSAPFAPGSPSGAPAPTKPAIPQQGGGK